MKQNEVIAYWIICLFFTFFIPSVVLANENDYVLEVYRCEDNIIIMMEDAGGVTFNKADVGVDNFERMRALAIDFLRSGEETGFFDPGPFIDVCEVKNLQVIKTLTSNNQK